MLRKAVLLSFVALTEATPAVAQQPTQAEIRSMATMLLQCRATLGAAPKIANRQVSDQLAAYAEFAGSVGNDIANDAALTKAERAKAAADGEAMLKPPHSQAEAQTALQNCVRLVEGMRKEMGAAPGPGQ